MSANGNETCGTCKHWKPPVAAPDVERGVGNCHAGPPQCFPRGDGAVVSYFPPTQAREWCSAWVARIAL